jgi:hypothetical protein
MNSTTFFLLNAAAVSLMVLTFLACIIKWRKTKDRGFLLLCLCFIVIPILWSIFDSHLRNSAVAAIRTGEARFLFLKMTLDPRTGMAVKGTLNPGTVVQVFGWLQTLGTELIKLVIVLIISRTIMQKPAEVRAR